jgi:hypothetical protein
MNTKEIIKQRKKRGRKIYTIAKALALEKGIQSPKKHGVNWIYEDKKIKIIFDDYGPNMSIFSIANGRKVLSNHLGHIECFVPGAWEKHLEEIGIPVKVARKAKQDKEDREKRDQKLQNKWGIEE